MPVNTDINNFKQEITNRINTLFSDPEKTTFINDFNKLGVSENHWDKDIATWDNFIDNALTAKKPDEEFKAREGSVLYTLAKQYHNTWIYRAKTGNKDRKKEALTNITNYQKTYTDTNEQAIYTDTEISKEVDKLKKQVEKGGNGKGNGKPDPETPKFTKQTELTNFITGINTRIDRLFGSIDKDTFISDFNGEGVNNHYWEKGEKWDTYLSEKEIVKKATIENTKPDEEFARRKDGVLYILAKEYMNWWIYKGKFSSSKAKKKEAIAKIEDYQTKYKETPETTAYAEKEITKDIQAIKNEISKKPTPPTKPKPDEGEKATWKIETAFVKVNNWWSGVIDNYVKGGVAQGVIMEKIDKQGRDETKFGKNEDWQEWFKTSKNQAELDQKWDWLEKEITKHLIDYWLAKGNAEPYIEEKSRWWNNYIAKFYNNYSRELARFYFHEASYSEKLTKFKNSLKTKPKDTNEAKQNAIDELKTRMDELYTGASLAKAITAINTAGKNDKSSDWGNTWEECINKGTDEDDIIERKGFVLKYLSEYFIKDMLERIDDQTDNGIAAKFYHKLKDYNEKYGLEMGVYEAFESQKAAYEEAEDRLRGIVAIGVPTGQTFTMVYARDYGRWAGKPARRETRQPQDDTGTQSFYKPSENNENK